MAATVMVVQNINPNELRRQRSQRELRQQVARQKCREACPDSDGDSEVPDCDNPTDKPKLKESGITGLKYFDKLQDHRADSF
jgi:hypothetical protein